MLKTTIKKFSVFPTLLVLGILGVVCSLWFYYLKDLNILNFSAYLYDQLRFEFIPMLVTLLKENQFCQVVVFSTGSAYFFYVVHIIYRSVILPLFAGITSSVTVHNTDPNFNAVIDFVSDTLLNKVEGAQCSLQATTEVRKMTRKDWIAEYMGTDRNVSKFEFRPDSDKTIHKLKYKGRVVMMSRSKSSDPLMGHDKPFTPESVTLWVWGSDNSILKDLLSAALENEKKQRSENSLSIFTQSSCRWIEGWELAMTKAPRARDSVILDLEDMENLLSDARNFLNNSKWYVDMGIPYRRGYLLYGPPGCGKTSFAQVLAGELHLDICMLNLTHDGMNDNSLASYLREAPFNSIIVLEDIDAIFVERGVSEEARKNDSRVSFSGLLNAIDGVASQEGRIFFMTTNHIEKLDPALIRPGRCDVKLELKRASKQQMERMFLRFYPNEDSLAAQFASRLPSNELSMATLQGHFLKRNQTAQECLDRIPNLLQSTRPKPVKVTTLYEHLDRVGLQQYAPVLENHGIETAADLASASIKVEDIESMSVALKYDSSSKSMFEKLLKVSKEPNSDDSVRFLSDEYALADISTMREAFLTAYPSSYEAQYGETAPFFRRLASHREVDAPLSPMKDCSSVTHDLEDLPPPAQLTSGNSSSIFSGGGDGVLDTLGGSNDERRIDTLGREFCEILSSNGKGLISLHNLKILLDMFPDKPNECVIGAPAFVKARTFADEILRPISLYDFLKRAGLGHKIHSFINNAVKSVEDLLAMKGDNAIEKAAKLKEDFELTQEEATDLAEILTMKVSTRHALFNFGLHSRKRIIKTFVLFYFESMFCESLSSTSAKDKEEITPASPVDTNTLNNLGFAFGVAVTSSRGRSLVSLIEILKHLKKYPQDPAKALATAETELLSPPYPDPPEESVPEAKPTDWVYGWLARGEFSEDVSVGSEADGDETVPSEEDLSEYADNFIKEGMRTEADLKAPPLLTEAVLENKLNVAKVGHRRKIIRMIQKLQE